MIVHIALNKYGILGYINNAAVNEDNISTLFSPLGTLLKINEEDKEIFSKVAGCGPAIIDLFVEGLSDGAVLNGMNRQLSYQVITEMIIGAAQLIQQSGSHPALLKDQVTTPKGKTIKALNTLEKHKFRYTLMESLNSAD